MHGLRHVDTSFIGTFGTRAGACRASFVFLVLVSVLGPCKSDRKIRSDYYIGYILVLYFVIKYGPSGPGVLVPTFVVMNFEHSKHMHFPQNRQW